MKDAITPGGTSLEVLAPYLPYGIDIQTSWKDGTRIGQLSSLNYHQNCVGVKLHGEDELQTMLVRELCLPVLRPFSALTTALEDGTVPAVEVARLTSDEAGARYTNWGLVTAWMNEHEVAIVDYGNGGKQWIWPDLRGTNAAAVDYLRSKGFALPVNGHPLVEGVDFIAKSAAATPMQEGRESQG